MLNTQEYNNKLEMEEPSLNQISFLMGQIKRNENLQKHFDMMNCYDKLSKIKTVKQLKYFHFCLLNNKYIKLNNLLTDLGFKQYEN